MRKKIVGIIALLTVSSVTFSLEADYERITVVLSYKF